MPFAKGKSGNPKGRPPKARARAHSRLASVLTRLGRAAAAKGHLEKARELEGAR